jgi:hypothetical protein
MVSLIVGVSNLRVSPLHCLRVALTNCWVVLHKVLGAKLYIKQIIEQCLYDILIVAKYWYQPLHQYYIPFAIRVLNPSSSLGSVRGLDP